MRQIFSVRFFAAVGGVVALFFLLTTIFATREVIEGGGDATTAVVERRIDFVERINSSSNDVFRIDADGLAVVETDLTFGPGRSLRIVAGTPGVDLCGRLPTRDTCAIVADLLGEAVVWFALVPATDAETVDLPAIDSLEDGIATLVNGWQLPFAPVLDRRCDDEFTSYRDFRDTLGADFTSVYSVEQRRLVAVECGVTVAYAPETTVPSTTIPATTPENGSLPPPVEGIDDLEAGGASVRSEIERVVAGPDLGATDRLEAAGSNVRTDDLDDPSETFTLDLRPGRVTLGHHDDVVESVALG